MGNLGLYQFQIDVTILMELGMENDGCSFLISSVIKILLIIVSNEPLSIRSNLTT